MGRSEHIWVYAMIWSMSIKKFYKPNKFFFPPVFTGTDKW